MSCSHDVALRDEHAAALVLREQAEPGRLAHQHLPRPLAEARPRAPHDPAGFHMRPNAALYRKRENRFELSDSCSHRGARAKTHGCGRPRRMACSPPRRSPPARRRLLRPRSRCRLPPSRTSRTADSASSSAGGASPSSSFASSSPAN